jgi:hypothetical protein
MAPTGARKFAAEAVGAVAVGVLAGVDAGEGEATVAGSVATGAGVVGNGSTGAAKHHFALGVSDANS